MHRIRQLPPEVAEKIAAGEVVERPASVVKELVENAVDAGATRITVELAEGGTKSIRVTDDGEGILPEDLALAFSRHATSKLTEVADLFAVKTLGFRGEALPSIAAVSRVQAVSAVPDRLSGASIEVIGGKAGAVRESAARTGTDITVQDLFFNVPARLKFLKKQSTELAHITDVVEHTALAYPGIHFELTHNQKTICVLPAVTDLRQRIGALYGRDLARGLMEVSGDDGYVGLRGWLGGRGQTRANRQGILIFLNGRFVQDRVLGAAVINAYSGRIEKGRYPMAFVFVRLEPDQVDVNVHPAKMEVRLRNGARVFTTVHALISQRLEAESPTTGATEELGSLQDRRERIREKIGQFFLRNEVRGRQPELWKAERIERSATQGGAGKGPGAGAHILVTRSVMQIHDSFILEETDEGFALIDQHALHERILYEETITRLRSKSMESQRLLAPVVIDADQKDMLTAGEHAELLRRAGLEVTAAGPGALAVHSVPELLNREDPGELLRDMLDALAEGSDQPAEKKVAHVAEVIACRGAVKAGQALTRQEMESILARRDKLPGASTCPHGRPTTLFFGLSELAGRFGRS